MHDVKVAIRSLRATPIVTAIALVTLAIGIGANTAIFSFVYALLLAPLRYPHAERLVGIWERNVSGQRNPMTTLNYLDYVKAPVFDEVAPTTVCCGATILGTGEQPVTVAAFHVGAAYFDILGAHVSLGRTFIAGEDQPGSDHVVVINHSLWVTEFGSDPSIVGRSIRLNGEAYRVVGVMPSRGPSERGEMVWLPLSFPPERMIRANHWLVSPYGGAVGLLKPGVTVDRARAELETVAARLAADFPETNSGWGVVVEPYGTTLAGADLKQFLLLLLAAVGSVLLIGCVNLASLMVARGLARGREVAIRQALGARRSQLIRQFMTESLIVSMAGGLLGLALGYATMTILETVLRNQPVNPSYIPYMIPPDAKIALNGPVLAFTFVVAILSGLGFGLVAAVRTTRASRDSSDGSPSLYSRVSARAAHYGLQRALIAIELALAFILLTTAGLLVHSLIAIRGADTGFSGANVLTAQLPIWEHRFSNDDALRAHFRQITAAISTLPGVRDVALTDGLPLQGVPTLRFVQIVGRPVVDRARRPECFFKAASPSYFRALGLRMREGRALLDSDRFGSSYVTVINQTMARLLFQGVDPVGQHVLMQDTRPGTDEEISWTIVGVIEGERVTPFDDRRELSVVYVPVDQIPTMYAGLVVQTATNPDGLREAIRRAISSVDKDQAIRNVRTVDQLEADARAPDRLRTWFVGLFAGIALLLSAVGIYGVFAHAVVQRTREVGIRAALGAGPGHLVWLILSQGVVLSVVGLGVGLVGAVGLMPLLRTFLFGVRPVDPIAMGATAVILTLVAMVACYVPARRATTIDPIVALRAE